MIGHAKVNTPVLPVPLTGPAYFVSHGGEAFPDLTIVLKGYGVTVDLVGDTQIKNGITTNTFKATPDAPFSSFELDLPRPNSALAANANLCSSKLTMPTRIHSPERPRVQPGNADQGDRLQTHHSQTASRQGTEALPQQAAKGQAQGLRSDGAQALQGGDEARVGGGRP